MKRHKTTDQTEVRNKQKLKPEEIFLDNARRQKWKR